MGFHFTLFFTCFYPLFLILSFFCSLSDSLCFFLPYACSVCPPCLISSRWKSSVLTTSLPVKHRAQAWTLSSDLHFLPLSPKFTNNTCCIWGGWLDAYLMPLWVCIWGGSVNLLTHHTQSSHCVFVFRCGSPWLAVLKHLWLNLCLGVNHSNHASSECTQTTFSVCVGELFDFYVCLILFAQLCCHTFDGYLNVFFLFHRMFVSLCVMSLTV